MRIRYKIMEEERREDAPFIGALISAIQCNFNCKGCINEHIKDDTYNELDSQKIIEQIIQNPFNKGIILGGLEWSLQPEEMKELLSLAKSYNLQTMVYTGLDYKEFTNQFKDIIQLIDYLKCGRYIPSLRTHNNWQYGVKLATSNQKIYRKGIDY